MRGQGVLPIIGIVPTQMPEDHIFRVNDHYINSIVLSGGVPLIFPLSQDRRVFERLLPIVDSCSRAVRTSTRSAMVCHLARMAMTSSAR